MVRLVAALFVVALAASAVVADIPPPPPPKGKKYINVNNEVLLGKDVSGYVFVKQVTQFLPGRQKPTYSKVELKTDKATAIPEPARRTSVSLFAVPQDAAKEFKTDDELFEALGAKKVKGAVSISFGSTATVSDTVKGDSVKWTTTITAIDDKGITKKVEGDGYEPPAKKPAKDAPEDSPEADDADAPVGSVQAPRGGTWIAGIAAFAALMLGGFWLAGRTRRKV